MLTPQYTDALLRRGAVEATEAESSTAFSCMTAESGDPACLDSLPTDEMCLMIAGARRDEDVDVGK